MMFFNHEIKIDYVIYIDKFKFVFAGDLIFIYSTEEQSNLFITFVQNVFNINSYSKEEFEDLFIKNKKEIELKIVECNKYSFGFKDRYTIKFIEFLRKNYKNYDVVKVMQ